MERVRVSQPSVNTSVFGWLAAGQLSSPGIGIFSSQTLTEVRALHFPEVFSKNNQQEVSGLLLPPSGREAELHLFYF